MTPPRTLGRAYLIDTPKSPAYVVMEERDRLSLATDRLLGVTGDMITRACEHSMFSDRVQARLWAAQRDAAMTHRDWSIRPAESLESIYEALKTSSALPVGRAREAQASSDFTNLLGNSLGRRLLASFTEADYGERVLMRPGRAESLRDQRVVSFDAPPDLAVLDPEASNYTEMPKLAESVGSFPMTQMGNIVAITRKVVINDDIGAIQRWIDELGRAARRTLARAVWSLWASNANAPDGVAWFHSSHANTQSSALSEAEVIAAIRKLLDQTRPGNNEKLGVRLRPGAVWLVVPNALWDAALKLNQTTASALYHLFGADNQYILVNPLLTDANDFGVCRPAGDVESVRCAFLNGREDPEFLIADLPEADQGFLGDRFLYKVRFEFGVAVADHRGAVKAVVA